MSDDQVDEMERRMDDVTVIDDDDDSNSGSGDHERARSTSANYAHKTDWVMKTHILHSPDIVKSTYSKAIKQILSRMNFGLSTLLLKDYAEMTDDQLLAMIEKTYPLLREGEGVELLAIAAGTTKLVPIAKPWTPLNIHESLGAHRTIFIRPMREIEDFGDVSGNSSDNNSRDAATSEAGSGRSARSMDPKYKRTDLTFKNPGKFMEDFDPERSGREMRKLKRKGVLDKPKSRQKSLYDENGRLMSQSGSSVDGRDLCDCCERNCPGCHLPCPKCGSCKCAMECRNHRRYVYAQVDIEGTSSSHRFPDLGR